MNKMVCSIELVAWVLVAMAGVALGLGFFTSGLIFSLGGAKPFSQVLAHQFYFAAVAFITFRIALIRIDKGWHRDMAFYGIGIAALSLIKWLF